MTPVDGLLMDMHKFAELGRRGVLLLMSDSTNALRPGYTESERTVGEAFRKEFKDAEGRIILATFASNISRIQQAINTAVLYKRKVLVLGRSMVNNVAISQELGYLDVPEGVLIEADELNRYTADQVLILTTGSQGEPMAGLSRMASNNHRSVSIMPGDTVIISATPIPGNETGVGRTIDNLMRLGARVVFGSNKRIHVSGHGSQEELKIMLGLIKPKYFLPVHGEYRMQVIHAQTAAECDIPLENSFIMENGEVLALTSDSARIAGKFDASDVYVDGLGIGDIGSVVIKDRKELSEEGVVVVSVAIDFANRKLLNNPDVISRGFVNINESMELFAECKAIIKTAVLDALKEENTGVYHMRQCIVESLGEFLENEIGRKPVILPTILEV